MRGGLAGEEGWAVQAGGGLGGGDQVLPPMTGAWRAPPRGPFFRAGAVVFAQQKGGSEPLPCKASRFTALVPGFAPAETGLS